MTEQSPPDPSETTSADRSERRIEKALDVLLGISSLGWAVMGLLHEAGPPLLARIGAALVNATVGVLFIARAPVRVGASTREIARALPSALAGLVAWRVAGSAWPEALSIAFVGVAALVAISLASLGRSFAIFPALRAVRERGPYAVVRHPAYALELLLVGISGAAHAWWAGVGLAWLTAVLLIPRITDEERVLSEDPRYAAYRARVRYRLVPGIY